MTVEHSRKLWIAGLSLALCCVFASSASADRDAFKKRGQSQTTELYDKGVKEVEAGNFSAAMKLFEQAHELDKNDADVLNMLAFTQRKTGKLDAAFENYAKALALRPEFPAAREYLGEAHIQAALRQIKTLKSYGKEGEKELAKLIAAFQDAAAQLSGEARVDDEEIRPW